MPHQTFSSKDDLRKSFWKNIHFGIVVAWCGVNWKILNFSEASILPSVNFSIHPFVQIILVLNLQFGLNQFRPPNSRNDLCLFFCLLLLWYNSPGEEPPEPVSQVELEPPPASATVGRASGIQEDPAEDKKERSVRLSWNLLLCPLLLAGPAEFRKILQKTRYGNKIIQEESSQCLMVTNLLQQLVLDGNQPTIVVSA